MIPDEATCEEVLITETAQASAHCPTFQQETERLFAGHFSEEPPSFGNEVSTTKSKPIALLKVLH